VQASQRRVLMAVGGAHLDASEGWGGGVSRVSLGVYGPGRQRTIQQVE
jgi:hypothetical protein